MIHIIYLKDTADIEKAFLGYSIIIFSILCPNPTTELSVHTVECHTKVEDIHISGTATAEEYQMLKRNSKYE